MVEISRLVNHVYFIIITIIHFVSLSYKHSELYIYIYADAYIDRLYKIKKVIKMRNFTVLDDGER
jgi:hypothetical protein